MRGGLGPLLSRLCMASSQAGSGCWHYYTQSAKTFKGDLYFYAVDHDLREQIDGRKCPVVMMTGSYDYLTPPEVTENTARRIMGGV